MPCLFASEKYTFEESCIQDEASSIVRECEQPEPGGKYFVVRQRCCYNQDDIVDTVVHLGASGMHCECQSDYCNGDSSEEITRTTLQTVGPSLKMVDPSLQTVDPSLKLVGPSLETVDLSLKTIDPSLETVDQSLKTVGPSLKTVGLSLETVDPSLKTVGPSSKAVGPSIDTVDPSLQTVDPSLKAVDPSLTTAGPALKAIDPSLHIVGKSVSLTISIFALASEIICFRVALEILRGFITIFAV